VDGHGLAAVAGFEFHVGSFGRISLHYSIELRKPQPFLKRIAVYG
jgi:hypothetical protein